MDLMIKISMDWKTYGRGWNVVEEEKIEKGLSFGL